MMATWLQIEENASVPSSILSLSQINETHQLLEGKSWFQSMDFYSTVTPNLSTGVCDKKELIVGVM